jgi:cell division protein FtsI (penicillin-binding protein 3)
MDTVQHEKLKVEGDNRTDRSIDIKAYRGIILDRNGSPLALSTPVDTVWVDPYYVNADSQQLEKIMTVLELSEEAKDKVIRQVKSREGRSGFVYIKRKVQPYLSAKVESIGLYGIHIIREFKRYYPTAEVSSHILGFTNVDGKGQEGIELQYNSFLTGTDGYLEYRKDLKGGVASKNESSYVEPKNGNNLMLSIDSRLQYAAYKYLKKGVIEFNADGGSVIIEDIHTGEILAMVNYPSYNPNDMADAYPDKRRNRAVTDVYELGSVMKVFTATAAMTYGDFTPDTEINTSPGYFKIGKNTVRDFRDYGKMDVRHILMKSSNVGVSKMILSMDDQSILSSSLYDYNFGMKTGIELPGERSGFVPMKDKWSEFPLATLSFGYGMNATDMQLVAAMSGIANDGNYIKPTILKREPNEELDMRPVASKQVSEYVISMLQSVVEDAGGTGSLAKTELYHIAGKTGTARKLSSGGGYGANYLASFVGVAPATSPQIAIAVTIDNPKGDKYGGGAVAAPIFSNVAASSLRIMGVKTDKI